MNNNSITPTETSARRPAFDSARSGPPLLVLVADNDAACAQVARSMLEEMGLRVSLACGGLEALGNLRAERFDAVICNLEMPGLNGFEVAHQVRLHHDGIALILMSGLADEETAKLAVIWGGADAFLPKPFTCEQLGAALRLALTQERAASHACSDG